MRPIILDSIRLQKQEPHSLRFRGRQGQSFSIQHLAEGMMRICYLPNGSLRLGRTWMVSGNGGDVPWEGRQRDDLSPFPLPEMQVQSDDSGWLVKTETVQVKIHAQGWLAWQNAEGTAFASDLPGRAYSHDAAGGALRHDLRRCPDELYLGFGEKSGVLNKAGRRLRMQNLDALGYNAETSDPLYKHFPFYITYRPDLQIAYGLLYDNLSTAVFDLGQEIDNYYPPYRYYQAEDGDLDLYLLYGPTIPQVLEKLAMLTGRMPLPPRWSLGYLGSTMAYTEAPDAQAQLARFTELCQEHEIPCDLFHLSSGYSSAADGQRHVFEWNREKIADPEGMAAQFHEAGMHLAANIKPCLLTGHPQYAELAAAGGFLRQAEAHPPQLNRFWGGDGSHIDFSSQAGRAWWQQQVKQQLLARGIDATWNDNNEYEVWDDAARCAGFGDPIPIGMARPLQTLWMVRASREAQQESRPQERPFVLTRAACPGMQRYAQTWSGDNETSWHTLRYNVPMGLGLGLSGMANHGHDVGGFSGPKPDPELFVRWVQNGIFHPRFTIHSWNTDESANEPWMHPAVLPIIRDTIRLRYRLLPYLYSLMLESAESGQPLTRPMLYHFPQDAHCLAESFDFMLGPNLLVASVFEPGARERSVYLPGEQGWYDFHDGEYYESGGRVVLPAALERIPLLVPAGGLLPLGKAMRHVGAEPDNLRQVIAFPFRQTGEGSFDLVEDDGISLDYRQGAFTRLRLAMQCSQQQVHLKTSAVHTGYPLPYDAIEWVLPPQETRRIAVDGETRSWRDAQGWLHVQEKL